MHTQMHIHDHLISTPTDEQCAAKSVPDIVRCTLSDARPTQYDMLPQHEIIIGKSISECF